ncbi:hypothetical protein SO802_008379 [Lithocarpus litseifolius]|uniref:GST N-terminal domain-containing protein n=1 Tax=Lithocarpus litseifolius TaxID=425828 RepID=A0AAW2D8F3_9ROSI
MALHGSSSSSGGSYTRWWSKSPVRVLPFSVAKALIFIAAAQEVHVKEPLPPKLVPKDVVLYLYETCPFCNKVKARNFLGGANEAVMYVSVKQGRVGLNIVFEPGLALRNPKGGGGEGSVWI